MLNRGDDAARIVAPLRERALFCDARGPVLRLSPGHVTQEDDMARLFAALRDLLPRGAGHAG